MNNIFLNKKAYDVGLISEALQRVPEILTALHHMHHDIFNALAPHVKSISTNIPIIKNITGNLSQATSMLPFDTSLDALKETIINTAKNPETKKAIKNMFHVMLDAYDDYEIHKPNYKIYSKIITEKAKNIFEKTKDTLKEKIDNIFNFFKQHKNERGEEIFNWHGGALETLKQRINEIKEKISNPKNIGDVSEIRKYVMQHEMDYSLFKKYAKNINKIL